MSYIKIAQRLRKLASRFDEVFLMSYLDAMLWASDDDNGESLDSNYDRKDVSKEALYIIKNECARFLDEASKYLHNEKEYKAAGHDFFLTRNGYGAGFWDGDWEEPAATDLTKLSKSFRTQTPYVGDDGEIYI